MALTSQELLLNQAFYVVAATLGGHAWDAAGPLWYLTLCDPALPATATFAEFARLTRKHAQRTYGRTSREPDAVRAGWDAVKVPV